MVNAPVRRRALWWSPCLIEALDPRKLLTTFQPLDATAFTAALNSAQLGDTIILKAGTTYTGQFTLPNKTSGTGWITIQSSALSSLPAPGRRVGPAHAVNMPKLVAPGGNASVVRTAASAHHYKFVGVEFIGPANNSDLVALISLGSDTQTTLAQVPHHLVFDRSYFHPNTRAAQIRRAFALNSAHTDITNSYVEEIHQAGSDSQAIGGWNGPGPFNIINNHLEAASENIMFGGATARIPNMVPSDIVIRGNHLVKPLDWRNGTNGSKVWAVKNLFELKAGRRVLVEGNVMENCWVSGQTGVAIVLKLGNYGTTPWNVTEDVTIHNNVIRHASGGVTLQGRDYAENSPAGLVRRLSFANNVFDDITSAWATPGAIGGNFLYMTHGPRDVTFDHNTVFNGRTTIIVDTPQYPTSGFVFKNNIAAHNTYGVFSSEFGTGNATLTNYFSDAAAVFTKNVLMGGNASRYTSRPGNYFPATWDDVGFVDKAGGNYRLASTSPYRSAGTDGKDLGANIDALAAATAGSISGLWPLPATPLTIVSSVASYVRDGTYAGQNFGSASELVVKRNASGYNREAFIRFDFSSVTTITSAKLRLFGRLSDTSAPSVKVNVYRVSSTTWSESGLTWNNKPTAGTTVRGSFNVSGAADKWYELDLTAFLKSELAAGRKIVTLALKAPNTSNPYATFASDETANGPRLVVTT